MHPIRTGAVRALAVTGGTALALSLGACGLLDDRTDEVPEGTQTQEAAQTADAGSGPKGMSSTGNGLTEPGEGAATDGGSTDAPEDAAHDSSDDAAASGRGGAGPEDGEPRTASLAGDDSIDIDDEGNGTVPKEALAADIEDLFVNSYDIPVDDVTCSSDMTVVASRGSQNCEIVTTERSYYGTVAIIGFEGEMVEYELYFPGLDEDALDLSDG
ncbi:hypothetical protein [Brevibacterium jeotgali]|uniref:DUF4333 domain-containing protein n=1 Tax=Brevibacterium jeotgali TaxID=1262550 RepID=A0A2H1L3U6_9MICO|nr:hypothetical protein [Brevibacterium jeotgali]TWC01784.1 hypothetical protein FB108_0438 [Brevibacterium jeotgali]SMY11529.1 hypothetical protein BJEO58_01114 [Brevibacterium jeotgali]